MNENVIVTLTTWSKRICNIPFVLDTIYAQTVPPDVVVLNLAYDEQIPTKVQEYINSHAVEVNWVPDTKVYKKLIPTLKRYPNACVISIDDDWLYPHTMIADFMRMHNIYPDFPISGNKEVFCGMQCHCGCASLTMAKHFDGYLNQVDDDLMSHCPSDDLVYTFLTNKAGHPYVRTEDTYFTNMIPYNTVDSYSLQPENLNSFVNTWDYMESRFGILKPDFEVYINDRYMSTLIQDLLIKSIEYERMITKRKVETDIWSSKTFRLGQFLMRPFQWMKYKLVP